MASHGMGSLYTLKGSQARIVAKLESDLIGNFWGQPSIYNIHPSHNTTYNNYKEREGNLEEKE